METSAALWFRFPLWLILGLLHLEVIRDDQSASMDISLIL